jgi:hypothetical protein
MNGMLTYYAIYEHSTAEPPRGIFVMKWSADDGLIWNHQIKAWQYNPALIARFIFDEKNWDRFEEIDRGTAERITLEVTKGREPLPSEETIGWIFQWKGNPPQSDD